MGLVIIPYNYEELPESERKSIVPICIASLDRHGKSIASVWFEQGVEPVQNQLRGLAQHRLRDVLRVSELTEATVHKLWARHGDDAGPTPWRRVLVRAAWEARAMAKGRSLWSLQHTVPLAMASFDQELYGNGLPDPNNYDEIYQQRLLVDLVERRIDKDHRDDIRRIFALLRQGYAWDELADALGYQTPDVPRKRFRRWVKEHLMRKIGPKPLHPGRHVP